MMSRHNPNNVRLSLRIRDDRAENSIMQTISIAVSAILIAAGLITAPSLINNARDTNAKQDLANIANAQEFALSDTGTYNDNVIPYEAGDGSLDESPGVKYVVSGGVNVNAVATNSAYMLSALSPSGSMFWRTSDSSKTWTVTPPKPSTITGTQMNIITRPNLVVGSSFNTLTGWSASGSSSLVQNGANGTGIQVSADGTIRDIITATDFPVAAGQIYYGEGWVKKTTASSAGGVTVSSTITGTSPITWPSFGGTDASVMPIGKWVKLSGSITIPPGYTRMLPRLSVRNNVTSGDFIFDEFTIQLVN